MVSFGFIVFLVTSYYYQTRYIPKGTLNILPDVYQPGEIVDDAFGKSTIILSDPTLADKFVRAINVTDERREINEKKEFGPQKDFVISGHNESHKPDLTLKDKWPRAGEPYIVPQMTENERNLKVKRFQQPKNGVNYGH